METRCEAKYLFLGFPRPLAQLPGALTIAMVCTVAGAPHAIAQDLLPEKSVSVRDRPRPEYDPLGIRLGLLRLSPRLTVTESYDDNIFATESDEASDFVTRLAGDVSLRSSGRIPWSLFGGFSSRRYADYSDEDYSDWQGGLALDQAFGSRTKAALRAAFARNHESRGNPSFPATVIEPSDFDTRRAEVDITRVLGIGQLKLSADIETSDYDDAKLAGGATLDQDFRDRTVWGVDLRSDFAIAPSAAVFVRLAHKQQKYESDRDVVALDRDASTDAIYAGAAIWISNLVRGDIGIGVLEVDNQDPSQEDRRALAVACNMEFYLTQLVTATLQAQRNSGAADIEGSATYVAMTTAAKLDYEMRRNLILAASFSHSRREYSGIGLADTYNRSGISAQWLWNRHMRLNVQFELEDRDYASAETGRSYNQKIVSAGATFVW